MSVIYIDINAILLHLDLNICQHIECFCCKLGLEVEYAKSKLKTSVSQIWVICQLLPFVRVGQYYRSSGPEREVVIEREIEKDGGIVGETYRKNIPYRGKVKK